MDYTLKLNEKHVAAVIAALDMYARVGTGEFSSILVHPDVSKALADRNPAFSYNARMLLDQTVRGLVYPPPGSREIGDTNRAACDILRVLRHRIASDKIPADGPAVN